VDTIIPEENCILNLKKFMQ